VKIPEQVQRLGVVVGALLVVVVVGRFVLIPRALVAADLHQQGTIERELARPVKLAGSATCQGCHEDVGGKKQKGWHRNLACEGCHAPAAKHAEDPGAAKPEINRERKGCPQCHAYDPSRPTGFPQINPTAHNPRVACVKCHDPHDPVPPHVPKQCAACHAQIERTKSVSSHALLECTTCHKAPEQHRIAPRSALPSKPDSREFCAQCHGKGAPTKEAPKVDLATHGGAYMCWQCHYPHLPGDRT
jgi:hypothetical protein